ncbi:MAG: putative type II secretion system protein HxcR [Verrucomicrobia subdivision 3 bacterium]|nr:putative type II secretion system protein HxcR [Limisphaerales bacterium]MCS1416976.1 putative type II secretion system protein HxcR [Limisphaerales bacterium]
MTGNQLQDVGDLLRSKDVINEDQLQIIRGHQNHRNLPVHRLILDLNFASERDTIQALAEIHSVEFRHLEDYIIPEDLLEIVPLKLIFHYRFIPLSRNNDVITIAYGDVPSSLELANLRLLLKQEVQFVLTTPSCIDAIIKSQFGLGAETVQKLRESKGHLLNDHELIFDLSDSSKDSAVDGTISDLVAQILAEALRLQTTDIHFEPYADSIKLRYRIDGILQSIPVPGELRPLYAAITSRLKVMAELDISERRIPQDGRISMKTEGEAYDLRVSVIPTKHGEALCLRILGRQSLLLGFEQLGMLPNQEALFGQITSLPQGLILISGPTGSGKTTTLYAALGRANDEQRKIITIEDPIEYQIEGITQMQTHDRIGLSFSKGLRSILRHDPDIVLVGEIRDKETAEIAVRASQTGHLVFSTIHANDSLSTIPRLIDMGVETSTLSASLNCSIAQRLARRTCNRCMNADPTAQPEMIREMAEALNLPDDQLRIHRGEGCVECQQTGIKGRIAIYEFAPIDESLAEAIYSRASLTQLRRAAKSMGWKPLRQLAFHRIQDGTISLAELQRVTWRLDFSQI